MSSKYIKWIAHRGAPNSYQIENTLDAFRSCIQNCNVDGIELDVHLTRDRKVVVCHDDVIEQVPISQLLYSELKKEHDEIPTLDEVVELLKPTNLELYVEIKRGFSGTYPRIVELTLEIISPIKDRVTILSFESIYLNIVKYLDSSIPTCYLMHRFSEILPFCDWLGVSENLIDKALTYKHLYRINVWTINNVYTLNRCLQFQVDSITTDYPNLRSECIDDIKNKINSSDISKEKCSATRQTRR